MNKNMSFSKVSIFVLVLIIFSACSEATQNNSAVVYKNGEMLTNNIVKTYFYASEEINFDLNAKQELADLLLNNSNQADIEKILLVENYSQKIEIFAYYSKILKTFESGKINIDVTKEFNSLLNEVDSLNNSEFSRISEEIRNYTYSVNFNNQIGLYEITNLLYSIWLKDVLKWQETLNESYTKYAKTIDNIPESVFDESKLEKFVYEPYRGKQNLVKVYKLKIKQEAFEMKNNFNKKTTTLVSAFDLYTQIINELTQKNPDNNFIYLSHEKILNQLNNIDNSNLN